MKLKELTPEEFMCGSCGCGCPAVFETEENEYVIIGKKLTDAEAKLVEGRVADDEYVIKIDRAMIDDIKK